MDWIAISIYAGALLLNSGTPGPSIAALVARVIARGWQDVAPFVAAMWLGEVIWLTLAMAGLTALAESFHGAFVLLKYLGAAYLLFLAWQMWTQPVHANSTEPAAGQSGARMFATGFALTLGNPKIMVFYLALLPNLLDLTQVGIGSWAVIASVTVACLMAVDLFWIVLAHRARALLQTPRALRVANRISATMLGGAAGLIATRQ